VFAVPGDLATPTGGYGYARRMIAELAALGWQTQVLDLGAGFPRPTKETHGAACGQLAALPRHSPVVVDGLAFGVLPAIAAMLRESHFLVALVHHPLALESGLSASESAALRASEKAALACARHVITTSAATARLLAMDFAIPSERLSVVEPGTDKAAARSQRLPSPPSPARGGGQGRGCEGEVLLLAVGAVVPRKGYDVLIAALARIWELPWRLVIVGDCSRSPMTARRLEIDIARFGLADRITLRGSVSADELAAIYAASDLFVLPSRFEGYGMAFAEAIAHGLPVVGTRSGAIPDTVPCDAGVLVATDDPDALAETLRRLIEEPRERELLAAGARAARFPSWRDQAARFARVLEDLA
jgi:glycosyltransferase involved in cell wall biosynthesis